MCPIVDLVRRCHKVRVVMYVIIAICSIITACHAEPRLHKFVPYSAKVLSFHTDKLKHGGIYCQNVKLDNKSTMLANGFSSVIQGQKTRLIDYIAVGDSIVRDTWGVIIVYREGSETYTFTHNPGDN